MNVRECRQCHRMIDFDEPWCDHETMEESAWIDIVERRREDAERLAVDVIVVHTAGELLGKAIQKDIVDELVEKVAVQLGLSAAEIWRKQFMELVDGSEGK